MEGKGNYLGAIANLDVGGDIPKYFSSQLSKITLCHITQRPLFLFVPCNTQAVSAAQTEKFQKLLPNEEDGTEIAW